MAMRSASTLPPTWTSCRHGVKVVRQGAKGFGFAHCLRDPEDVLVHVEVLRRCGLADRIAGRAVAMRSSTARAGKMAAEGERLGLRLRESAMRRLGCVGGHRRLRWGRRAGVAAALQRRPCRIASATSELSGSGVAVADTPPRTSCSGSDEMCPRCPRMAGMLFSSSERPQAVSFWMETHGSRFPSTWIFAGRNRHGAPRPRRTRFRWTATGVRSRPAGPDIPRYLLRDQRRHGPRKIGLSVRWTRCAIRPLPPPTGASLALRAPPSERLGFCPQGPSRGDKSGARSGPWRSLVAHLFWVQGVVEFESRPPRPFSSGHYIWCPPGPGLPGCYGGVRRGRGGSCPQDFVSLR